MPATSSGPETGDTQAEIDRRRGAPVPWIIAGFYLAFMSALISFVVIAYQHPPNAVTEQAYEKGLAYNTTLDRAEQASQLGWKASVAYDAGAVTLSLKDRAGQPLDQARVRVWFVHPDRHELDRTLDLTAVSPGLYAGHIALPAHGAWAVHATAMLGDRQVQTVSRITAGG